MNEIEKALSELKGLLSAGISGIDLEMFGMVSEDSFRLAISALEKQIPKKIEKDIVIDEDYSGNTYEREIPICPSCNNIYLASKQSYCNQCGQKIDWRVE